VLCSVYRSFVESVGRSYKRFKTISYFIVCSSSESVKKSVKECAVCEASMGAFDVLLGDPNVQKDVEQLLKKVCPMLPPQDQNEVQIKQNKTVVYVYTVQPANSGIPKA